MFYFCSQYSTAPSIQVVLWEKRTRVPQKVFHFLTDSEEMVVRVTEVLAPQSHTDCSLLNTAVTRGQVCSFSCHFAQIPSLSANSKKQFRHVFVLGKKKNCYSATALSFQSSKYSLISGPFRQTPSFMQFIVKLQNDIVPNDTIAIQTPF